MSASPYAGRSESEWPEITKQLTATHPLKADQLLDVALTAWRTLWKTTVGTGEVAVGLFELRVPATVVGYFFEILFARELELRAPQLWRGNRTKDEKDLVFIPDPSLSVEIKSSGQAGFKIYGNRSYGQKSESGTSKKEKSGYYITVNFFHQTLTLIRFGWIDAEDWDPQEAPTGQMAGLKQSVYNGKLLPLVGSYRRDVPVFLLTGVGPSIAEEFAKLGINSVGELISHRGDLPSRLAAIKSRNAMFLEGCG